MLLRHAAVMSRASVARPVARADAPARSLHTSSAKFADAAQKPRSAGQESRQEVRRDDRQVEPRRQNRMRPSFFDDDALLREFFPNDLFRSLQPLLNFGIGPQGGMRNAPSGASVASSIARWKPALDIAESKDAYTVHVELPGASKDNVSVDIEDDSLVVHGEVKHESTKEDADKKWKRVERQYGSFQRRLPLPADVDTDKIKATFKDGILDITLPRSPAKSNRRSIEVNAAATAHQ